MQYHQIHIDVSSTGKKNCMLGCPQNSHSVNMLLHHLTKLVMITSSIGRHHNHSSAYNGAYRDRLSKLINIYVRIKWWLFYHDFYEYIYFRKLFILPWHPNANKLSHLKSAVLVCLIWKGKKCGSGSNLTLMISISERRHSGFPHFAGRICHSYSQVALRIYHREGHCLLGYLYNCNEEMGSQ